jgi:quercetin dioxygenase-like cupin family protein
MKKLPPATSIKGPAERFKGNVTFTTLKEPTEDSKLSIADVTFEPGAHTAWHSHPHGQTLYVTEGEGVIQQRGGEVLAIKAGDVIWTGPDEEHWHGATPGTAMTHIAIQEADEQGNFAEWHEHITDEEYARQPQP